jgi:signal transduction histidine kinase
VAAQADGARYALAGPEGERKAAAALDLIAETARGSIGDLRELLAELRYAPGTDLVARMRASGMDLRRVEHGTPRADHRSLLAEALTNALKHGDLAHPVQVEEDWCDGYRLVVRNRLPEPPRAGPGGTGHGLLGMRERVERAGGRFSAAPDGRDWVLRAELP